MTDMVLGLLLLACTSCVRAGFDAGANGALDTSRSDAEGGTAQSRGDGTLAADGPPDARSAAMPADSRGAGAVADAAADGPSFNSSRCGPFSGAEPIAELNSAGATDWAPSISSNQLTIYFTSDRGASETDIWVVRRARATEAFGVPTRPDGINTGENESSPALSPNDLELYFARSGVGLRAVRSAVAEPLGAPAMLEINGWSRSVVGPWISGDGRSLYFTTWLDSSLRDEMALAVRTSLASPFVFQRALDEVGASGAEDGWPTLSPDGLELLFESDRGEQAQIYVARRASLSARFSAPELLEGINGSFETGDPDLSRDGRTLYYASTANGDWDIWQATRSCP